MTKGAKRPFVRFFASDWLAGTRGMKAAEIGAYITLIALMYERCEPLPNDTRRLARQCGCAEKTFEKILEMLIAEQKIVLVNGGLWNGRVEREFEFRKKISSGASAAATRRWKTARENNGPPMQVQCDRTADAMLFQKPYTPIANAIGREAPKSPDNSPPDPTALIFDAGLKLLVTSGKNQRQARAILGKWRKEHSDAEIIAALGTAQREGAIEPVAFIERCLRNSAQAGPRETEDGRMVYADAFGGGPVYR